METTYPQSLSSEHLSPRELSRAEEYMYATRDDLLSSVHRLSELQWHFQLDLQQWSIAGIVEHLVLIEERICSLVANLANAPLADPGRHDFEIDETILSQVRARSSKLEAPPAVQPSGRWSPREALAHFVESRNRTLGLLVEGKFLRGHLLPHPVLGALDGYQWILATAAHTARHTGQIRELENDQAFPTCAT